jgi:glycosyltransferase involved in cell wall biosynthesis
MRIAIVVPPWIKIPPEKYGGIEVLISFLSDGLADKGHEVTLFTISTSETKARKFAIFDYEMKSYLDKPPSSFLNVALTHTVCSYLEIAREGYDIVHDHTWKEGLACGVFFGTPVIHTIHSPIDEENKSFYALFKDCPGIYFVTISDFQQTCLPGLNYVSTVYNGIDLPKYPYRDQKDDYYFWIGRFNEEKAPHLACEVSRELGKKLILAGKVNEKAERDYFASYITPYLGPDVEYIGEVGQWSDDKMDLLSHGKAYLYPIQWDEPFGITMIEAMACGTPVVTFKRGSTSEVIAHGTTGYVVESMQEFVDALQKVDQIDPKECRKRVENMFTAEIMVENYERMYMKVLEDES